MTKYRAPRWTVHSQRDSPTPPVRPTSQYVLLPGNDTSESTGQALAETVEVGAHSTVMSGSTEVSFPAMDSRGTVGVGS